MATKLKDNIKLGKEYYEQYKVGKGDTLNAIAKAYLIDHGKSYNVSDIKAQVAKYKRYNDTKTDAIKITDQNNINENEVLLLPYTPVVVSAFDGQLQVTASWGVNIKDKADYKGKILVSDKNSKGKTYKYRKNSMTQKDSTGRVWVEVLLDEARHSTGWLPVSGPSVLSNPNSPTENWVTFI
jgi:LysM repeat protein